MNISACAAVCLAGLLVNQRALAAEAAITVQEIEYQGQTSFKIVTPSATWIYHERGAGFASLIDRDGDDWISYHPGGGSAGEYRGIPNCGVCFHPGYTNSTSRVIRSEPHHVTIYSETMDGAGCAGMWDIYPDHATFTMLKTKGNYWFLYEGTPAGKLQGSIVRSSGERTPLSEVWSKDIPAPEWIYFEAADRNRSLFLIHHEDDDIVDQYWPMEGNMTVFGFGRKYQSLDRYLTQTPAHFTIALRESRKFGSIRKFAQSRLKEYK
jgi:hypothetical protein